MFCLTYRHTAIPATIHIPYTAYYIRRHLSERDRRKMKKAKTKKKHENNNHDDKNTKIFS